MCEKLITLCKLQLNSIVEDLDKSVSGVDSAARNIMESVSEQQRTLPLSKVSAEVLAASVHDDLNSILIGLQFHDELTQRLEHLNTMLDLLSDQSDLDGSDANNEKLLDKLTNIFSSNAEFRQLRKVFPSYQVVSSSEAIELF